MENLSSLTSFPLVWVCQVDHMEDIEKNDADSFVTLGDIAEKREDKDTSPGLCKKPCMG